MKVDTAAVWKQINAVLVADLSVDAKMQRVIDVCDASFPHPDWKTLRSIDYSGAVRELASWFGDVVEADPPDIMIRGVWVGVCNPVVDGKVRADMYFAGAERFDREDPDWASEADYYPEDAYAGSSALRAIYEIAYGSRNGLGNEAEWPLALAFPVFAVRDLLAQATPALFRGSSPIGVSVGFDSGDFFDVGELTVHGLRPFGGSD